MVNFNYVPLSYREKREIYIISGLLEQYGFTVEKNLPQKMPLALVANIEEKHLSSTNFVTGLACWSNSGFRPLTVDEFIHDIHRLVVNKDLEFYKSLLTKTTAIKLKQDKIIENGILKSIRLVSKVKIPKGVKKILGCKEEKDVDSIYYPYKYFYDSLKDNDILNEVEMDDDVIEIGEKAFENAHYLSKIKLSNNLTTINILAFNNCYMLKEITLPISIKYIGEWSFAGIKNLHIIYEGSKNDWNLIDIDETAFDNSVEITYLK